MAAVVAAAVAMARSASGSEDEQKARLEGLHAYGPIAGSQPVTDQEQGNRPGETPT
jgi:hypothetical protein